MFSGLIYLHSSRMPQLRVCPAAYPPRTRVSFQHPVIVLVQGVIYSVRSEPGRLAYVIDVNFQDTELVQFMVQSSDICVIR